MVRAQPPDPTPWWERVEDHPTSALARHAAERMRKVERFMREDEGYLLWKVVQAKTVRSRYAVARVLAARPGLIPRRFANPRAYALMQKEAAGTRLEARTWLREVI